MEDKLIQETRHKTTDELRHNLRCCWAAIHQAERRHITSERDCKERDAIYAELNRRSKLTQDEALEEAKARTNRKWYCMIPQGYFKSMCEDLDDAHKAMYMGWVRAEGLA